jgi:hypothetical protein
MENILLELRYNFTFAINLEFQFDLLDYLLENLFNEVNTFTQDLDSEVRINVNRKYI